MSTVNTFALYPQFIHQKFYLQRMIKSKLIEIATYYLLGLNMRNFFRLAFMAHIRISILMKQAWKFPHVGPFIGMIDVNPSIDVHEFLARQIFWFKYCPLELFSWHAVLWPRNNVSLFSKLKHWEHYLILFDIVLDEKW